MKKIFGLLLAISLASASLFSGCYYDNEEELYGTNNTSTCDSTSVKYAAIVSILDNNGCLGCHSAAAADVSGGGYNLDGYDNVKSVSESNNRLYNSVSHASGFSPMPKGGAKITACEISKINSWIVNGYPQ